MRDDYKTLVEGLDELTARYANVFPMVYGPSVRAREKTLQEWKAEYKGDPDIEIEIGDMRTRVRTFMSDAGNLEKRAREQLQRMGVAGKPDWGPQTDRVFREDRKPDPKPIRGDGSVDRLLYGAPSHDLPRLIGKSGWKAPVTRVNDRLNLDFIAQGNSWGRHMQDIYPYPSVMHWNYNRSGNMHGPPAGSTWWQEHGDDPDIWGSPNSDRKLSWIRANLNQDHPAVRKMILDKLKSMAAENRTRAIGPSQYCGVWEYCYSESKGSYGYSPQSIAKFRQWLKARFNTVEALNRAWRASYASFEAIDPPADTKIEERTEATPLTYEFEVFRKKNFHDFLQEAYETIKAADPDTPVEVDSYLPWLNGPIYAAIDNYRLFRDCGDLVSLHRTYHGLAPSFLDVYSWSLARYAPGKTQSNTEWYANMFSRDGSNEEFALAAQERNMWQAAAFGTRVISILDEVDFDGTKPHSKPMVWNNMCVSDVDYSLLRRSGAMTPVMKARLNAVKAAWFGTTHVVDPKIAVLQPTASTINSRPLLRFYYASLSNSLCNHVAVDVHDLLFYRNYAYRIMVEEALLAGEDSLDDIRVLILPYATNFPPGLGARIVPWVRSGGTLISAGPFGIYDHYGFDDGEAINTLFGKKLNIIRDSDGREW